MDPRNVAMDDAQQFPSQISSLQALDQRTPRKCFTVEELSQLTGLSVSSIRRYVKDGTIPFLARTAASAPSAKRELGNRNSRRLKYRQWPRWSRRPNG
jgi:predicted DNA-binding transcriptional regulator AlpA